MVFVLIQPIGSQDRLPLDLLQSMGSALGVSGVPISTTPDGSVTLGLPEDRFRDRDTAKASRGMVLRLQYGEDWDKHFRVVDG